MLDMDNKSSSDAFIRLVRICKWQCFNAVERVCLLLPHREGPHLLLKLACTVILYMLLTYWWYSAQISSITFDLSHFLGWGMKNLINNETENGVTGGLRMVVFGGGDVATPSFSASEWNDQGYAWTEIMCQKLGCDTYVSFVPETDNTGGAVISNSLIDAAYGRVSTPSIVSNKDRKVAKIDYLWATEQYPKAYRYDLAAQVDSFLSSPRSQRNTSTESLWVFNIGYWDVWYLAALPRKLATEVLDSSVREVFFQIERLYQAAQDQESVAFSGSDSGSRAPFCIFLTRLFDISLTPGFASARPTPPSPHSGTSQLRNAAFLTKYWDALLEVAVDDWLATPDPEDWSTADTIDIKIVEALSGKRSLDVRDSSGTESERDQSSWRSRNPSSRISLPRRKVASYGISHYLRELMIDRQLRNADLSDHNGLGARPPEDGFLDISMPCALEITVADIGEDGAPYGTRSKTVLCREPDNYLFYTGFTVSPRAIHEIGVRAARRFLDQAEPDSRWREKARMQTEETREHE
ncbi:hypothetical protein F4777DRAFT_532964 [Nemania sp. FL0916]|nr:hypothetical protein F4777DRAFT_532964 [Nemania sp. FL0916]